MWAYRVCISVENCFPSGPKEGAVPFHDPKIEKPLLSVIALERSRHTFFTRRFIMHHVCSPNPSVDERLDQ